MKPTTWVTLASAGLGGAVLLWGTQWVLVSMGQPALVPPATWSSVMVMIAGLLLVLAWPIRARQKSPETSKPVDPFYSTRVVLLAKASSLTGAGLLGGALGVLVFLATRPVVSSTGLWLSVAAVFGAILLLVAAWVAEKWCTLPPDESDTDAFGVPEGEPG
jgi:hypothetical protein